MILPVLVFYKLVKGIFYFDCQGGGGGSVSVIIS